MRRPTGILMSLLLLMVVLPAQKKTPDRILQELVQRHLEKYHVSPPKIMGLSTFDDRNGTNCRIVVSVRANRPKGDLVVSFAALAQAAAKTRSQFNQLIVTLVYDQHYFVPEIWICDYQSSLECFVYNQMELSTWLGKHLYQKEL